MGQEAEVQEASLDMLPMAGVPTIDAASKDVHGGWISPAPNA
jgi:hypothetical protein